MAVLSGCMSNKQYLYGPKFEVIVDHKPLVPLYNSPNRPAPVRVDRHKSKLRGFTFKVTYEPGNTTPADYGSRHPPAEREYTKLEREDLGVEDESEDKEIAINQLIEDDLPEAVTLEQMKKATKEDKILCQVVKDVMKGKMSPETENSEYGKVYEELTTADGLLLKGERLVVPASLQAQVIALSHEGHGQGETKTITLLRERVWWPRMGRMTKEYVATCLPCTAAVPRNVPAPMVPMEMPEGPWQTVHCDFKGPIGGPKGYYFHVTIDAYSRWPVVAMVRSTSYDRLEPVLEEMWATYGIPEKVVHDGGPPYESHNWRRHARRMGFQSVTCTPEHPQSNGLAEKFMSTVVKVTHAALVENKDPREAMQRFLMMYRATPHSTTGKSPSKIIQGRKMRLKVPIKQQKAEGQIGTYRTKDKAEKEKQKNYVDKRRRATEKKILVDDEVLIKQEKTTIKPPWDPRPMKVTEVKGTKVTAKRGPQERTRNIEKFKIIKKRPKYLKTDNQDGDRKYGSKGDTDDEDDWMEYTRGVGHRLQEHQPVPENAEIQEAELSTDEEEPGPAGINREVGLLIDKLSVQPDHQKRQSKPTKRLIDELGQKKEQENRREKEVSIDKEELSIEEIQLEEASIEEVCIEELEQERRQVGELERELSKTRETRCFTPRGSPGPGGPEEDQQGLLGLGLQRSQEPGGDEGDQQGLLELEQPRAAPAISPAPVPHRGPAGQAPGAGPITPGFWEHYQADLEGPSVEQWLIPQGLVNIPRVEVIDPQWSGVDEPEEQDTSEMKKGGK